MRHLATIGLLAAVLAFAVFGRRAAAPKVEYRVSGYFPRGFPLHGEVKLLSAPVVDMGRKEKVGIQYTVGDIAIEPGLAVEVWKHFTSDTEEFLPRATFSRTGVEAETQKFPDFGARGNPDVFRYRRCARVTVAEGTLAAGDRVTLDLGQVRMQHYQENLFNPRPLMEATIPLEALRRDGYFAWRKSNQQVEHPYMKKMGLEPAFFLECELVDPEGPLDASVDFQDGDGVKAGDYYYLRAEQLDTNKAWSSPR